MRCRCRIQRPRSFGRKAGSPCGLAESAKQAGVNLTTPRLRRHFFARDPVILARDLLGRILFYRTPDGLLAGRIVEAEAYTGAADPASHAFRGRTARNTIMFGPAGHAYVYFSYGMHHCLNVTADAPGLAGARLLRALGPPAG